MAFPTIATADTKNGTVTSNSTSWTLTYPTNIGAGDLLLAFIAADGNPGQTFPSGWGTSSTSTGLAASSGGTAVILRVFPKVATGSETGTFNITLSASEQGGWRIFRIPAASWNGGTILADSLGSGGGGTGADGAGFIGATSGTSADPPSFNPTGWDVEDTLWIAAIGVDTSRTINSFPANCPDLQTSDVSGGSNGATLAIAMANSATASFNPDAFTTSGSDDWAAMTVAVRPATPPTPVHDGSFFPLL